MGSFFGTAAFLEFECWNFRRDHSSWFKPSCKMNYWWSIHDANNYLEQLKFSNSILNTIWTIAYESYDMMDIEFNRIHYGNQIFFVHLQWASMNNASIIWLKTSFFKSQNNIGQSLNGKSLWGSINRV